MPHSTEAKPTSAPPTTATAADWLDGWLNAHLLPDGRFLKPSGIAELHWLFLGEVVPEVTRELERAGEIDKVKEILSLRDAFQDAIIKISERYRMEWIEVGEPEEATELVIPQQNALPDIVIKVPGRYPRQPAEPAVNGLSEAARWACFELIRRLREAEAAAPAAQRQPVAEDATGKADWQEDAPGYVPAKDIMQEYDGKKVGNALVIHLKPPKGYRRLSRFANRHGVRFMQKGRRTKYHAGAMQGAVEQHGLELAKPEATPEFMAIVLAEVDKVKTDWECKACGHKLRAAGRPEPCPKCDKNAMDTDLS